MQCGDIACELFLTTDPLNMGGENTMPTEPMGATSGGRSFGRGLWARRESERLVACERRHCAPNGQTSGQPPALQRMRSLTMRISFRRVGKGDRLSSFLPKSSKSSVWYVERREEKHLTDEAEDFI